MRILQIINSLTVGGAEKFVVETTLQLKKEGHQVEVLVIDPSESEFLKTLKESGVEVRYTLSHRFLSPLNLFSFVRHINSPKYDVVHTHLTYAQLWGAVASLFPFRKTKLITTEHSNNNNRRSSKLLQWVDRFIYSRYSTVICISETTRQSLVEWLGVEEREKFIVVPNCVNVAQFKNVAKPIKKSAFGFSENDKVVMMVGRMSFAKDQKTLIEAIELLPDGYKCVLVGQGETFQEVESCIKKSEKTAMAGLRCDIAALLAMCDIYVQSSHWEGLPTTVLEAMAAGKLVLGSNVRGIVDVLPAEQLFDHQNAQHLADLILQYTQTEQNEWQDKQNKIVDLYDVKRVTHQIEMLYE